MSTSLYLEALICRKKFMNRKTDYFKPNTRISNFIPLPRFVLTEDMTTSSKVIYGLLVARTMLSQKEENQPRWTDALGRIYITYSFRNLAIDSKLSKSTVSAAMAELKQIGLVESRRSGYNMPNRIYVKYMSDPESKNGETQISEHQKPGNRNSEYQRLAPIYTESKQKKDIFPDSYRKIHNFEERHRSPEEWDKLEEMLFNV